MPSYLERYQNGAYEQVWAELTALGEQVRQEPLLSNASLLNRWHRAAFVEYLRECFRWGGFPGLDISHPMNPNHLNANAVMPPEHLALLTADLLPV